MNTTQAAKQTPAGSRAYNSPLREHQAERTRELILDAATQQLSDGGIQELNIPRIARRAGISIRTVYRHFPTREVLLDDLSRWLEEKVVAVPPAKSIEDLQSGPLRTFPAFDENEALLRAHWITGPGREVRSRGRQRRLANYRRLLDDASKNLSPAEQREVLTVIAFLLSSRTWQVFKDEFGMNGDASGKAVSWAVTTLIADIRDRNDKTAKQSAQQVARKET